VYRTAVAAMVHKVAENAQFVTTTFHPELVKDADKCYGVTFANAVRARFCVVSRFLFCFPQESHVGVVDKATALRFIEEANRDK
jgi:structural maintenance of chromosome 3 (chondroitin sulfate proteoglycan 6)